MSGSSGRTIPLAGASKIAEADMEESLALLQEQRSAALNELQQQHARLTNLRESTRASLWRRKGRNREIVQVANRIGQLALTYSELSRSK